MNEFWTKLSERERIMVGVGGAVVAAFVLIQFILVPIIGWRDEMGRKRDNAIAFYEVVARASALAGAAGASAGADTSTPVRNVVSQSAARAGVELNFVNQRPDDGVDVNASAEPAALYAWLAALESEHAIAVAVADIARESGEDGKVRAQLTLVRRAAW
ncbi:MAG: type II secretion system protein GspM [Parvularculaceae bacterium]